MLIGDGLLRHAGLHLNYNQLTGLAAQEGLQDCHLACASRRASAPCTRAPLAARGCLGGRGLAAAVAATLIAALLAAALAVVRGPFVAVPLGVIIFPQILLVARVLGPVVTAHPSARAVPEPAHLVGLRPLRGALAAAPKVLWA